MLYATVITGSAFSVLFFLTIVLIERLCVRWAPQLGLNAMLNQTYAEPARDLRVAARADVVVVGGGPAGFSAAVAAARHGASVCLVERYPYLGGLASGGMVLVLDDMCAGSEITVRGICAELVDRMRARGHAVFPPEHERGHDPAMFRKWSRWGLFDFNTRTKPHPICYAVAFDPDGWKRASDDMVREARIDLRLHSLFAGSIVRDGRIDGVVVESKAGREAIIGSVVIDATGDLDVAASAGAAHSHGAYMVTTVFRLGRRRHRRGRAVSSSRSRSATPCWTSKPAG